MKTLFVRINQRKEAESFWRCAIQFSKAWKKVSDLDAATAQRLEEEQMLEVSETRPADYPEDDKAGDSAVVSGQPAGASVPPAAAPEVAAAEVAAAEAAAAEAAAAEAAAAEAAAAEAAAAEAAAAEAAAAEAAAAEAAAAAAAAKPAKKKAK